MRIDEVGVGKDRVLVDEIDNADNCVYAIAHGMDSVGIDHLLACCKIRARDGRSHEIDGFRLFLGSRAAKLLSHLNPVDDNGNQHWWNTCDRKSDRGKLLDETTETLPIHWFLLLSRGSNGPVDTQSQCKKRAKKDKEVRPHHIVFASSFNGIGLLITQVVQHGVGDSVAPLTVDMFVGRARGLQKGEELPRVSV